MDETESSEAGSGEGSGRGEQTEQKRAKRVAHFVTEHPLTTVVGAAAAGLLLGAELLTGAVVGLAGVLALGSRKKRQERQRMQQQTGGA
jgi:hypothetical protein